jgi:hypothetical protein
MRKNAFGGHPQTVIVSLAEAAALHRSLQDAPRHGVSLHTLSGTVLNADPGGGSSGGGGGSGGDPDAATSQLLLRLLAGQTNFDERELSALREALSGSPRRFQSGFVEALARARRPPAPSSWQSTPLLHILAPTLAAAGAAMRTVTAMTAALDWAAPGAAARLPVAVGAAAVRVAAARTSAFARAAAGAAMPGGPPPSPPGSPLLKQGSGRRVGVMSASAHAARESPASSSQQQRGGLRTADGGGGGSPASPLARLRAMPAGGGGGAAADDEGDHGSAAGGGTPRHTPRSRAAPLTPLFGYSGRSDRGQRTASPAAAGWGLAVGEDAAAATELVAASPVGGGGGGGGRDGSPSSVGSSASGSLPRSPSVRRMASFIDKADKVDWARDVGAIEGAVAARSAKRAAPPGHAAAAARAAAAAAPEGRPSAGASAEPRQRQLQQQRGRSAAAPRR